jgi:hypothetical protein
MKERKERERKKERKKERKEGRKEGRKEKTQSLMCQGRHLVKSPRSSIPVMPFDTALLPWLVSFLCSRLPLPFFSSLLLFSHSSFLLVSTLSLFAF